MSILGPVPIAPRTRRPGVHTIVLDPGHGGTETGAIGAKGTQEKSLTLALAQALRRLIEERLAVRVVTTRTDDSTLSLTARSTFANQNQADLFVSLHQNYSRGSTAHGAETYFLSLEASDDRAAALVARLARFADLAPRHHARHHQRHLFRDQCLPARLPAQQWAG